MSALKWEGCQAKWCQHDRSLEKMSNGYIARNLSGFIHFQSVGIGNRDCGFSKDEYAQDLHLCMLVYLSNVVARDVCGKCYAYSYGLFRVSRVVCNPGERARVCMKCDRRVWMTTFTKWYHFVELCLERSLQSLDGKLVSRVLVWSYFLPVSVLHKCW